MADCPLYTASVPVFQRYLGQLGEWLARAETHGGDDLLSARLAPDMLPLEKQVAIAAHFTLRAAYPLAGLPVPPFGDAPATWAGLRERLDRVASLLGALTPAQFEAAGTRMITSDAGEATLQLDGATFLHQFALPNFFFHLAAAYAILRQQGVPLGKADFDGFHRYDAVVA
jgi:uncharacterized protein